MELPFHKGKAIADSLVGKGPRELGLDKVGALGLQDFFVRHDAVHEECFGVRDAKIADERCVRPLARPFQVEIGEPGDVKELERLAKEEGVVLLQSDKARRRGSSSHTLGPGRCFRGER